MIILVSIDVCSPLDFKILSFSVIQRVTMTIGKNYAPVVRLISVFALDNCCISYF